MSPRHHELTSLVLHSSCFFDAFCLLGRAMILSADSVQLYRACAMYDSYSFAFCTMENAYRILYHACDRGCWYARDARRYLIFRVRLRVGPTDAGGRPGAGR